MSTPATTKSSSPSSHNSNDNDEKSDSLVNKKRKNSKQGDRSGAPSYRNAEVETMLDIAQEVQPFGSSQWAIVANKIAA